MSAKLELVREEKLYQLIPGHKKDDRLEASGVAVVDGYAYVVFDNQNLVGKIDPSLETTGSNDLIPTPGPGGGFEDITYDPKGGRFYLIVEAARDTDGKYRGIVSEYDSELRFQRCARLSTAFEGGNKGFEGVAHLWRGETEYLLALCEGNLCTKAKQGGGRIQVFERTQGETWRWAHQVDLPLSAEFEDYAALKFHGDRVAVVSQASRRVWIGDIDAAGQGFAGEGMVYKFPDKSYCNVEGVAWLSDDLLVAVSDRRKKGEQPKRCADKDQSIHVFRIPSG